MCVIMGTQSRQIAYPDAPEPPLGPGLLFSSWTFGAVNVPGGLFLGSNFAPHSRTTFFRPDLWVLESESPQMI